MAIRQLARVIQVLRNATQSDTGLSDGHLLGRFIERRDDGSFAALVHRHGPMVWGLCRRVVGNHHDAEDAFQATFLVLACKASSVNPREMVANWLYGVAHRTALRARATVIRRQKKERHVTSMPEPEAKRQDLWPDLESVIDQELSRLPDMYRIAILLCDLEGRTGREVARQLKIPEGTLASRLRTARMMLAKRLTRRGVSITGAALTFALSQSAASASAPAAIVASTVKIATSLVAGSAVGMVPAKVAALMKGALKTMLLTKLQAVVGLIILLGVSIFGGALLAQPNEPDNRNKAERVPALQAKADKPQVATVSYPVADLVVPIQGLDGNDETATKQGWLIQKIKHMVEPESWEGRGGRGSIKYTPKDMRLIVNTSPAIHARVNHLLETMRRAQDIQVSVISRIVTIRSGFLPKVLPGMRADGQLILNHAETLALLEKLQTDQGTSIMTAPKMTLFSGQRTDLTAGAMTMKLTTYVAANLRHVELDVAAKAGQVKWAGSTRLTDGATLVLAAPSGTDEVRLLVVTPHVVLSLEETESADKSEEKEREPLRSSPRR